MPDLRKIDLMMNVSMLTIGIIVIFSYYNTLHYKIELPKSKVPPNCIMFDGNYTIIEITDNLMVTAYDDSRSTRLTNSDYAHYSPNVFNQISQFIRKKENRNKHYKVLIRADRRIPFSHIWDLAVFLKERNGISKIQLLASF